MSVRPNLFFRVLPLAAVLAGCMPHDAAGPAAATEATMPRNPDEGIPLAKAIADGAVFRTGFEDASAECWGDRNPDGWARSPCGHWGGIGPWGALLATDGTGRNGAKSLRVTYDRNESRGGATLALSADTVHVRAYYRFADGFDFGQGVKVGRIRCFNHETQENDIDIIMTVRSSGDEGQCGRTDMSDLGLFYNGRPAGRDWGHLIVPFRFERSRWYAVEYEVDLNAPGRSDGKVALWIDGRLQGEMAGLAIRGPAESGSRLNLIQLGGWYSNSALGNPCVDPSEASVLSIDDVAVGSGYIGVD